MLVWLGIFNLNALWESLEEIAAGRTEGAAIHALLILATIRNPVWATAYLVLFGIGTIPGMALITTAIAIPSVYGTRRFARVNQYLVVSSGHLVLYSTRHRLNHDLRLLQRVNSE
jgi:hypothetical protein